MEIKKIDKYSLAKITAFIYGLIGFVIVILLAIFTITNIIAQQDFTGSILMVTLFNSGAGILLGILLALLFALIGFIIGFITAGIYNILAQKTGGIKIELSEIKKVTSGEETDITK